MADTPRAEGVNSVRRRKTAMKRFFLAFAFAMAFIHGGCGADKSMADTALQNLPTKASSLKAQSMKIRLKVEDKVMTATLIDSKTTRAFVSLLPLTLTMNDLFRRENSLICRVRFRKRENEPTLTKLASWFIGRRVVTWPSSIGIMARRFLTPALSSSGR